jgi:hypothetical protein
MTRAIIPKPKFTLRTVLEGPVCSAAFRCARVCWEGSLRLARLCPSTTFGGSPPRAGEELRGEVVLGMQGLWPLPAGGSFLLPARWRFQQHGSQTTRYLRRINPRTASRSNFLHAADVAQGSNGLPGPALCHCRSGSGNRRGTCVTCSQEHFSL